jgi:hypothetical protein
VTPRDVARKTEGQDGVAVSFLVGLFHSLQHAGLSRRTLINALTGKVDFPSFRLRLTRQVELLLGAPSFVLQPPNPKVTLMTLFVGARSEHLQ